MNGQPPYYQNSIIPIEKPKLHPPWYPFVYISGKLFSKSIHSDTFKLWSTHSNFIITNSYQKTYTKISVCIVHSFESISFFSDGCLMEKNQSIRSVRWVFRWISHKLSHGCITAEWTRDVVRLIFFSIEILNQIYLHFDEIQLKEYSHNNKRLNE